MNIKRGGVYLAALDPTMGHEIAKTRPVVVISNDKNNTFSGTITVLPITSKNVKKTYPFEVVLAKGKGNLPKKSKIKADQIRTLDKRRLIKTIGRLSEKDMFSVENAVNIHLDLT
ncbi:MAG: type II toxin-antitoxin system PemK/MazF family toxin [Deltaproteobacteria bacterium]|jgi:mRNA interferase MazF|nr:type II toxin-antitoxin system PemK/MazF family toxin [Deltaproteobacteria bacterium]